MRRSLIVQGLIVPGVVALAAGAASGQNFFEGFDDINVPLANGWFTVNNSEDPAPTVTGWFQGIDDPRISSFSGPGTSYAGANYQATQGVLGTEIINMWLLTPTRTLNNGDVLKFYTRCVTPATTIYPDRMQVRLSTAGSSNNVGTNATSVGDFTTLLMDINPTYSMNTNPGAPTGNPPTVAGYPETWRQYTLTLSGLPAGGVSGRFAFRYFVEGGGLNGLNSNFIGVDDAEYTAGTGGTGCYANCDNSTTAPCLNVNDFICFNNAFAAALPYANCDASTISPVLNVNDFICFNNAFASQCGAGGVNNCSPRP